MWGCLSTYMDHVAITLLKPHNRECGPHPTSPRIERLYEFSWTEKGRN